jgi:hypothetical protein
MQSHLRALSARLLEAREEERAAISRRVHDELGQTLTALQWDVAWLVERLAALPRPDFDDAAARLEAMTASIAAALQTVRKVACELRPPMLDQFGLATAIHWQAEQFQARYRVPCEVVADLGPEAPSRMVATALFRIFQELLTNVARHARAARVRVRLGHDAGHFTLVVQDDGCGMTDQGETKSLGILGMRERTWLLGGSLVFRAAPGGGTVAEVRIPSRETTPVER